MKTYFIVFDKEGSNNFNNKKYDDQYSATKNMFLDSQVVLQIEKGIVYDPQTNKYSRKKTITEVAKYQKK